MALSQGDLTGTKNGSNVTFTIPVTPIAGSEQIIFNTGVLKPVPSSPGPTQCIISGTTVTLGLAPNSTDNLWYFCDVA